MIQLGYWTLVFYALKNEDNIIVLLSFIKKENG